MTPGGTGSIYGANTVGNQGGGNKKQGLPPTIGRAGWLSNFIKTNSGSSNRGPAAPAPVPDVDWFTGNGFNDTVYAIAFQTKAPNAGKIIVAGTFTTYKGVSVGRIARLNTDGSLDTTFNTGVADFNSVVWSLDVYESDDYIMCGGEFGYRGGDVVERVCRLEPNGALDTTFDTTTGADNTVRSIAIQQDDGDVVIGGRFTTYKGTAVGGIARLKVGNGDLDTTFNKDGAGFGGIQQVYAIAIYDDNIIVGGNFDSFNDDVGTHNMNNIMVLNKSDGKYKTAFDEPLEGGFNGQVYSIGIDTINNCIWCAGAFTQYTQTTAPFDTNCSRVIALQLTDGLAIPDSVNMGANALVRNVTVLSNGKIIIVGDFTAAGVYGDLVSAIGIAKSNGHVNTVTGLDTTFNTNIGAGFTPTGWESIMSAAIQTDGKIVVGGAFTKFKGATANKIMRLEANGNAD